MSWDCSLQDWDWDLPGDKIRDAVRAIIVLWSNLLKLFVYKGESKPLRNSQRKRVTVKGKELL